MPKLDQHKLVSPNESYDRFTKAQLIIATIEDESWLLSGNFD
jgi:hypothetical protein